MAQVRDQLHAKATKLRHQYGLTELADELDFLAEATRRRPYLRKKGVIGPKVKMTPANKRWARSLRQDGLSYDDIGRIIGITNVGRISEACAGIKP